MSDEAPDYIVVLILSLLFVAVVIFVAMAAQPKVFGGWVTGLYNAIVSVFKITSI